MEKRMPKILLVEDNTTMLSLLETLLQFEGYQVVQSRGGKIEEIMALIENEAPSLALIDVNTDQVNGFDLLCVIRKHPEYHDLRVIMSSGTDYSTECREGGADSFILKPYMPDDLMRIIHQMLDVDS